MVQNLRIALSRVFIFKKVWEEINELVYNKQNRLAPSYLTYAVGDNATDIQKKAETFNESFENIRNPLQAPSLRVKHHLLKWRP